jgi:hypothetical protein
MLPNVAAASAVLLLLLLVMLVLPETLLQMWTSVIMPPKFSASFDSMSRFEV